MPKLMHARTFTSSTLSYTKAQFDWRTKPSLTLGQYFIKQGSYCRYHFWCFIHILVRRTWTSLNAITNYTVNEGPLQTSVAAPHCGRPLSWNRLPYCIIFYRYAGCGFSPQKNFTNDANERFKKGVFTFSVENLECQVTLAVCGQYIFNILFRLCKIH